MNDSTPLSTTKPDKPDKLLPAWYYDAFALKIMGLTYAQIGAKLKHHEDTVKKLFARSGPMFEFWREYVENHKKNNLEEVMDMFWGHLPDIAKAAIVTAKSLNMTGVVQRDKIFDLTLGKPTEKLKVEAMVGIMNFSDWAKIQAQEIRAKKDAAAKSESQRAGGDAAPLSAKPA